MSSDPSHAPVEPGTPHPAPGLPTVHDEAADTPLWVPILGACLVLFFAGWAILEIASHSGDTTAPGDGGVSDGAVVDGAASDAGTPAP